MKVNEWTGDETLSVKGIIKVLNELAEIDPIFMKALVLTRIPCNHKMRDHETVQCHCYGDASMDKPKAGFLGILNGLIGIDKSNSGPIETYFDEKEGISFVLRDSSN